MAITKSTEIGKMDVVGQYKIIQVRTDTIVKEDNKVISRNFHLHTIEPNISAVNLSKEHADVQTLANSGIWTDDLKTAYANYVASI